MLLVPHPCPLVLLPKCAESIPPCPAQVPAARGPRLFLACRAAGGKFLGVPCAGAPQPKTDGSWRTVTLAPSALGWVMKVCSTVSPNSPVGLSPSCPAAPLTCLSTLPSLASFPSLPTFTRLTSQITLHDRLLMADQPLREPKLTQEVSSLTAPLSACPGRCLPGRNGCDHTGFRVKTHRRWFRCLL